MRATFAFEVTPMRIEALRAVLRGHTPAHGGAGDFEIIRSRPHGHVAAALGSLRRLDLHSLISRTACRERDIVCALVVARILDPRSKLATVRGLREDTLTSSLGAALGQLGPTSPFSPNDVLILLGRCPSGPYQGVWEDPSAQGDESRC
jgi:hypothetical protein